MNVIPHFGNTAAELHNTTMCLSSPRRAAGFLQMTGVL